jgi:hypothetical protein
MLDLLLSWRSKYVMDNSTDTKKKSINLTFDFNIHTFLSLGFSELFYLSLWHFIPGLYRKTQVSSPVTIFHKRLGFSNNLAEKFE